MREMKTNQFEAEEKLVAGLRRLSRESSRAASPDVAAGLATAFRRHHRRRRTRNAAIVVLAICALASVAAFLTKSQKQEPVIVKRSSSPVSNTQTATTAAVSSNTEPKKITRRSARQNAARSQRSQTEARPSAVFLPLPSYDPAVAAVAKDELQLIRVEMPIQDLRLVGVPVGADVPNRPVRADFVVGHDGTPYAVRLVQ